MSQPLQLPEHDKLAKVQPYSQKIGEFLDWLREAHGFVLYETNHNDVLVPVHMSLYKMLGEFFDIDLEALEAEKMAILEQQRRLNDRNKRQTS